LKKFLFLVMTAAALAASAKHDTSPADSLSEEAKALWHAKKGNWDEAHNIAQEIHTPTGSWIHALLHMIEGDMGNAGYWFHKAGKPARRAGEIDALWNEIAGQICEP
jgi:hypothetical protein